MWQKDIYFEEIEGTTQERYTCRRFMGNRRELGVIHPAPSFFGSPLRFICNLYSNKSMVENFIRRDIRVRYRNSILGYIWTVLQPLLLSGVYYFLFVIIAGTPEKLYPIWVLIGVITWQYFSRALNGSITSLSRNSGMIKQIYFPREIFPVTTVGSNLIITCLSMTVVIPFIYYYNLPIGIHLTWILAGLAITTILALGMGMLFAPLNAIHGDVSHLFQFITKAGFFLSPVMWTMRMVPSGRNDLTNYLLLNPMVVPLEMMRCGVDGASLGIEFHWIAYSVGFALTTLVLGVIVFMRTEWKVVKHL